MKGKQEPANSQTPDTEEACKGIKSGDDAPPTMLNRYFSECLGIEIFASREALDSLDRHAWRNGGRLDLFATFQIANELANIYEVDKELEVIAASYADWWIDVRKNRIPMRRVSIRLPYELVDALDEFRNRVELFTDTSIGTTVGFLLARAMLLNR